MGTKEDSCDECDHKSVHDQHDTVIHQGLHEAPFLLPILKLKLTVAAREPFWAGTFSIPANSSVEALAEALSNLTDCALEVNATVLITLFRHPHNLHQALVTDQVARKSHFFGLVGCDFATAGETAVVSS